jgi:hypothetical protein
LDKEKNHAWVSYAGVHGKAHVDRPLGKLVYLTSSLSQVPRPGLFFDPLLEGDQEALRATEEDDEQPGAEVEEGADAEQPPPLPPAPGSDLHPPQAPAAPEQPEGAMDGEEAAGPGLRPSLPHLAPATSTSTSAPASAGPRRSSRLRKTPDRFRQ